jgi:hypothetical protein
MKLYRGPPMTLSNAAGAGVRLIVWCKECRHQVEPDPLGGAENVRARLVARAAGVFPLRRPAGRYRADRNKAVIST